MPSPLLSNGISLLKLRPILPSPLACDRGLWSHLCGASSVRYFQLVSFQSSQAYPNAKGFYFLIRAATKEPQMTDFCVVRNKRIPCITPNRSPWQPDAIVIVIPCCKWKIKQQERESNLPKSPEYRKAREVQEVILASIHILICE